jgi:HK97 family phage major capsid protein
MSPRGREAVLAEVLPEPLPDRFPADSHGRKRSEAVMPPSASRSFYAIREGGSYDTASETAEGTIKPVADINLDDELQVVAKTIAHFVKIKRQQLSDVPGLGVTLNSRLNYGVLRRVENQIVAGDGSAENLTGLLHTTGLATVTFSGSEPLADLALDGIVSVMNNEADPDCVVLSPTDYGTMLKLKATGSGERLDSEGAFSDLPFTMWGLPAIVSTVLPAGTCIVGSFGTGCTLFVREGVTVRVSDAADDDFTRNKLTLLGEGRFGLAVWQPSAFAVVHFAAGGGASGAS